MKCIRMSRACHRSTRAPLARPGPAKYSRTSFATLSSFAISASVEAVVVIVDPFRERRRVPHERPVSIPAGHCTADGRGPREIERPDEFPNGRAWSPHRVGRAPAPARKRGAARRASSRRAPRAPDTTSMYGATDRVTAARPGPPDRPRTPLPLFALRLSPCERRQYRGDSDQQASQLVHLHFLLAKRQAPSLGYK